MKGKIKSLIKNKRFIIFLILLVIFFIFIFFLRGVFFTGSGSKYGNRLDGINKISFTDKDQKSVTDSISADEKVSTAKIVIHGKAVNIHF